MYFIASVVLHHEGVYDMFCHFDPRRLHVKHRVYKAALYIKTQNFEKYSEKVNFKGVATNVRNVSSDS